MIGAVEQCIASAKSLNFHDSPVMGAFMRKFYSRDTKPFIELPDGTLVTAYDAVKWIKEQEVKAREEEERKKREAEEAAAAAEAAKKAAEEAAEAIGDADAAPAKPAKRRRTKKETPIPVPVDGNIAEVAIAAADAIADEVEHAAVAAVPAEEVANGQNP